MADIESFITIFAVFPFDCKGICVKFGLQLDFHSNQIAFWLKSPWIFDIYQFFGRFSLQTDFLSQEKNLLSENVYVFLQNKFNLLNLGCELKSRETARICSRRAWWVVSDIFPNGYYNFTIRPKHKFFTN